MSTGLELLPLALAIGAAVAVRKGRRKSLEPGTTALTTRMRDEGLLVTSMQALGHYYGEQDGVHCGSLQGIPVAFRVDPSGTWEAHFDHAVSHATAQELIVDLDEVYARLVQQNVYQKLIDQASSHGLTVESEYLEDDESIVLTLLVEQEARA